MSREDARRAEEIGDLDQAAEILQHITQLDPADHLALTQLGVVYGQMGLYDRAIGQLSRAIELQPSLAVAYSSLGTVLLEQGRDKEATDQLARSIELRPTASRYVLLGSALLSSDGDAARRAFEAAVELDPDHEEAHFHLARTLCDTSPESALKHLERAVALDLEYVQAWVELGMMLIKQGEDQEALRCLERAIELDPGDSWPHLFRAELHWSQGRTPEAEAAFRAACGCELPGALDAHLFLARFYLDGSRADDAAEVIHEALQLLPTARLLGEFIDLLVELGRRDDAIAQLKAHTTSSQPKHVRDRATTILNSLEKSQRDGLAGHSGDQ